MNEQVKNRLEVAEKNLLTYEKDSDALAGFVFGSVGYGFADKYSDLEIGIIWEEVPEEDELKELSIKAKGTYWMFEGLHEQKLSTGDAYQVDGLQVEPAHWPIDTLESIIREVVVECNTMKNLWLYERQATLAMLQRGKVVFGEKVLCKLREKISKYPQKLSEKMVELNIEAGNLQDLMKLAERNETPLFQFHLVNRINRFYILLYGLNKIYHPSFKWNQYFLSECQFIPENFIQRVNSIFQNDFLSAVDIYKNIVEDLFHLVEKHMPQLNVEEYREQFYKEEPIWGE